MKKHHLRPFLLIILLIIATGAAMAYSSAKSKPLFSNRIPSTPHRYPTKSGIVDISGHLVQNKVLQGSDGTIHLSLTLRADEVFDHDTADGRNVDMVIVMDRSGSMQGQKIEDARHAILNLLSALSEKDRFALIAYSDGVRKYSDLLNVSAPNRKYLESVISGIRAGGGTNLGAGLQEGINTLLSAAQSGNVAKAILISDGLANKGITSPQELGNIAAIAVEKEFALSTVGVGADFNEYLMTAIADKGAGVYYYLENPSSFAEVFQQELYHTQATVATGVSVQIPLKDGVDLVHAAGYPIRIQNDNAVFYPGDLRSGQTRNLFLTLRVPSDKEREFEIGRIKVIYTHELRLHETALETSCKIACVKNRREVFSSIDKTSWTRKVIQEDFNKLKQEVARDIKSGKKQSALDRIQQYYREQESINTAVGSATVTENLDKDLTELRNVVEDTFQGAPAAVYEKQKSNSKALQYEGYSGRRLQ